MNHRSEFDGPWFISFHKFSMLVDRWRVFQVRHSTYTFNGNATGWFACLRTPDTEKFFHRWITNHATWLADSAPIVPWRHQLRHRYTQTIAHFCKEKKIQGKAMLGGSDKLERTRENRIPPSHDDVGANVYLGFGYSSGLFHVFSEEIFQDFPCYWRTIPPSHSS